MSQDFRLAFDEYDDEQTSRQGSGKAFDERYPEPSHVRNICFVWPNGRRVFLGYSYLISGEYNPDESTITLTFTTIKLKLVGICLEKLFYYMINQQVKQIVCLNERYNCLESNQPIVNDIAIISDQ